MPNIVRLRSWRLRVELAQDQLATVRQRLEGGYPIIVPVATELLPYWLLRSDLLTTERITEHAIVIVGMDVQDVYVNDPDFETAPQAIDIGWFTEAWRHHDNWYAVIQRRFA